MINENKLIEAQHLLEINRFRQSVEILCDLLAEEPSNGEVLYLCGVNYYNLNEYVRSKECIIQCLSLNYYFEESYSLLGLICIKLKELVCAEEHFLESLSINPENPTTLARYGLLMLMTGHDKKSLKLLQEARRIEPQNTEVLKYWFDYASFIEQVQDQLNAVSEIVSTDDDELSKRKYLARYEILQKNYRSAYTIARDAYSMDPCDPDLLLALKELKVLSHPLMWPMLLAEKLGGSMVVWGGAIVLLLIVNALKMDKTGPFITYIYLGFCIYTWIMPPLLRRYVFKN